MAVIRCHRSRATISKGGIPGWNSRRFVGTSLSAHEQMDLQSGISGHPGLGMSREPHRVAAGLRRQSFRIADDHAAGQTEKTQVAMLWSPDILHALETSLEEPR